MRRVLVALSCFLLAVISLVASQPPFPTIGVAAIAVKDGKVLVTKKRHIPPMKHLPFGESPSRCAIDELKRSSGLSATASSKISWTTDVCDPLGGNHITVFVVVDEFDGLADAETCEWVNMGDLPAPVCAALKNVDSIAQVS